MKTKDALIIEIEALKKKMQMELEESRERLYQYSDYAMVYGDLQLIVQSTIIGLTYLVSKHKEIK